MTRVGHDKAEQTKPSTRDRAHSRRPTRTFRAPWAIEPVRAGATWGLSRKIGSVVIELISSQKKNPKFHPPGIGGSHRIPGS